MSDVLERVKKVVVQQLSIENPALVTEEASFTGDLGADSLDAVDIIMGIEDEFGISVDDEKIQSIKTVADLVNAIDEAIK